jgi:thiol-disulfide isomerase/thioredoxin
MTVRSDEAPNAAPGGAPQQVAGGITPTPRRRAPLIALAALAAVGAVAAVYGVVGASRNAGEPSCRASLDVARRIAPLVHGEVAAVRPADEATKLPVVAFRDAAGAQKTLADWHGRTVLLNLWATWCVPCRKEMPALDALQDKLGAPDFEVVSVNIDTRDPAKPRNWLRDVGIGHLAYYADANAKVFQDLKAVGKAFGMPTTLLVDPNGCEIASLAGPAEWASEDGIKLVSAALGRQGARLTPPPEPRSSP